MFIFYYSRGYVQIIALTMYLINTLRHWGWRTYTGINEWINRLIDGQVNELLDESQTYSFSKSLPIKYVSIF